jgi:hypothetical protein
LPDQDELRERGAKRIIELAKTGELNADPAHPMAFTGRVRIDSIQQF